jgi:hypothetical protein
MAFSHPGASNFGRAGRGNFGRFAHGRHFAFRHGRFFRHRRFAFVAGGYDDCYTRVWTRWGWQWIDACY